MTEEDRSLHPTGYSDIYNTPSAFPHAHAHNHSVISGRITLPRFRAKPRRRCGTRQKSRKAVVAPTPSTTRQPQPLESLYSRTLTGRSPPNQGAVGDDFG